MVTAGKLAHVLRIVDRQIEANPTHPQLQAYRAEIVRAMERDMPAVDPARRSLPQSARPRIPDRRSPEPGQSFVAETASVVLVWVPPGRFIMSNPLGSDDDTWVTLTRGFWLGQTEVTQEQWQTLNEINPLPSFFKGSDQPVEWVAWDEAMEFCRQLTERERAAGRLPPDYDYTLPTEAQWEFASRAGSTSNHLGDLRASAWFAENSDRQTHPVAQKQPNAWGLYDMAGNVWEWCFDAYGGYVGGEVSDIRRDSGADAGSPHMIRGGAFNSPAGLCRPGLRYRQVMNYTGAAVGFRVALVPRERPAAAAAATAGTPR